MANVITPAENSNYENWQMQVHGNVLSSYPESPNEEYENGIAELNELAASIDTWAELLIQEAAHA